MGKIALHIFDDFLLKEGKYIREALVFVLAGLGTEEKGEVKLVRPQEGIFRDCQRRHEITFLLSTYGICVQELFGDWDTVTVEIAARKAILAALEEGNKTYRRILGRVNQIQGREEILNIGIWEANPSGGLHFKRPKSTEFKMVAAWS